MKIFTSLNFFKKDIILKNIIQSNKYIIYLEKVLIVIHIKKIEKVYDYFILQSICLLDTISSQKPKLKVLKCKYNFGSKTFSYSCKVTLRKRKLYSFLKLFNMLFLSEMKRRHLQCLSLLNLKTNSHFSFSIHNTNIFFKLDEFYFKWDYPIILNFVIKLKQKNFILLAET
jgi:ribosomal protein L5